MIVSLRRCQPVFPFLEILNAFRNDNEQHAISGLAVTAGVVLATSSLASPDGCMRWQAMNATDRRTHVVRLVENDQARLTEIVDGGKGPWER